MAIVSNVVESMLQRPVAPSEPLVSSGLVDSITILDIVMELEKRLEVKISNKDVKIENFDSLLLICSYISSLRKS
jgi:acyl carrier protein